MADSFIRRQHMIHIQQDNQLPANLPHAPNEVRIDPCAERRRRINILGRNIEHFVHRIDDQPD